MNHRPALIAGLIAPVVVLSFACDTSPTGVELEETITTDPWLSSYSILDGTDPEGSEGFIWLPPIARHGVEVETALDRSVLTALTVEICPWAGDGCAGDPVAVFDANGENEERLRISEEEGQPHYIALWSLRDGGVEVGESYRIRVLANEMPMGHADVVVTDRGQGPPASDRGEFFEVPKNRTLPVKFLVTESFEEESDDPNLPGDSPDEAPSATALVVNQKSSDVSLIDVETNALLATIAVGARPVSAAYSPDRTTAYVASQEADEVSVIDMASRAVSSTIAVGDGLQSIAVSPNGLVALVGNVGSDDLSVVDLSSGTVTGSIGVCDSPYAVAFSPADGSTAYVTCSNANTLSVVDVDAGTVASTIAVGSAPRSVAITSDGATAYVANFVSNDLSIVDLASGTETATIAVGTRPSSVALTPDGATAYVTNQYAASVTVIDTGSAVATESVSVGSFPSSVAVAPDGSTAYVANFASDDVSLIEPSTHTVTDVLGAGSGPVFVAIAP